MVKKTINMEFDLTKVKFDQQDLYALHDVILEALDKDVNDEQLVEYWNILPKHIKLDAVRWGASDTPTQDEMHV